MRYAVTGAAGFVGSHLSEALAAAGHEVVGIDCFTDYYDVALKEENARGLEAIGCEVRRLDLAEASLDFASYDGVFHLAAQPGVRSFGDVFPLYLRHNVLATQRVFEAAARDGVKVVFASSSSVYGAAERYPTPEETPPRPISPYGITKLACEQLADAYATAFGLRCTVLRYFNAFGPRQRPGHGVHAHRSSRSPTGPASSSSATVSRAVAGRTSRTWSTRRSRRWSEAKASTTSAAHSRRR